MYRSYKLRLKPTAVQRIELERLRRLSCDLYNAALQERIDAWQRCSKSISLFEQYRELTELRKSDPEYAAISLRIMRTPLCHVDSAFKSFFKRIRNGEKAGRPRFKSTNRYKSIGWEGATLASRYLRVPKLGLIRYKSTQKIVGSPKCTTIIKKSDKKWIARIVCDVGSAPEKVVVSNAVGMDVGLTALATLSDGTIVENPRWAKQHEDRIAKASQLLARKKHGSKNRKRALAILRLAHERAKDARTNYLHHVSKLLVSQYDLIAYEDLKISKMVRGRFAKSIMDAAWATLIWQISYKAESAGRYAIAVNPKGTTQRCSSCSTVVPKEIWDRQHDCTNCGLSLSRDHNAAINILRLGESLAGLVPSECSV